MRSLSRKGSPNTRVGGASHLLNQQRTEPIDLERNSSARLSDKIDSAKLDGFQCGFRPSSVSAEIITTGRGDFDHDLAETQPVRPYRASERRASPLADQTIA